jgi:peptidyl-prolyl cis-trans isomerase D
MAARTRSNRVQQIVLGVIVGLIVLAFVFVFGQPSGQRGASVVADVDGESVRRAAFEYTRGRFQNALSSPEGGDSAFEDQLDRMALEAVTQNYIMAQEARTLGLRVSDGEIAAEICGQPVFQGGCDPEIVERLWRRIGFSSERDFTDEVRRELLIRKLTRVITSPIRVSEATAEEALRRDRVELRLRYVAARGAAFAAQVAVGDEEAEALAAAEPERIRAAYERRIGEFQQPEQVRARHILFTGDGAMERAQQAKARIEAGQDFVVLANEVSEDEATRELGGDLGFFPQGRMVAALDEAAFTAELRTLVGPVESERGIHLLRVEERREALDRSVEQVSLELARDAIRADRARDLAREAADQLVGLLAAGQGFAEAARSLGLDVDETIAFRPAEPLVPGIGRVPGLRDAATRLTPEEPHSLRVFGSGDVFYVISLANRRELDAEALAAELPPTRERMLAQARSRVMAEWYRQRREELVQSGRLAHYPLYEN